ncbi:transcription antitermination factor NusB [Lentilactobacillus farraginis]|uniref:Transcription antitermination protein NusB n=1 Tax=Lentilactobacillus farraginis DSM 18382 = JCM 14108 TaxID=1423743 RepID=X0PGF9_9LACO|nr:transcription antitermination factor NusB [Lentilactobacillus farraginis]KRM04356.1 transcription antitermination protein NusB [Lentilactobacillus farraginis DSM 18382 = JCM 14108]GAF36037.1 transcription termination protein NusB [Lentilactobacillus farraginis DSM 18382 = JCM 14108]
MELTRHQIREIAFQTLFALNANQQTNKEDFFEALTNGKYGDQYPKYLNELVTGVMANKEALDNLIEKYLKSGWSINRIAKTDLVILEIALYEMLHVDDLAAKISINEAIELAKKYSDDRSRKFVNGILSHALEELVK